MTGRPVDPAVLRYELLKTHYRSNMNFTAEGLKASGQAVQQLRDTWLKSVSASRPKAETIHTNIDHSVIEDFKGILADDLNVSGALGVVFTWLKSTPIDSPKTEDTLRKLDKVIGFRGRVKGLDTAMNLAASHGGYDEQGRLKVWIEAIETNPDALDPQEISAQIDYARAAKDYAKSDALRKQLEEAGYIVESTRQGTVARKKLV